jgi:hypothetical protein
MAAIFRNQPRLVKLVDEVVKVVTRFENDITPAPAVAAARAALGAVRFSEERHRSFAAVPRTRVNLDLVDEHVGSKLAEKSRMNTDGHG